MFQSAPPVKRATDTDARRVERGEFQSAPPVKRATLRENLNRSRTLVSIRAPREEGDSSAVSWIQVDMGFNPRPP